MILATDHSGIINVQGAMSSSQMTGLDEKTTQDYKPHHIY